ncbi:unnamed protein product [Lampetra fluviatilis]
MPSNAQRDPKVADPAPCHGCHVWGPGGAELQWEVHVALAVFSTRNRAERERETVACAGVMTSVAERAQRQRFASHLAHASGLSPAGPNFPSGATENRHGLVTEAQCVMVSCDSGQQEGPTAAPCSATAPQQQQQHGLLLSRAAHKRRQAESVAPAPSRERRGTLGGAQAPSTGGAAHRAQQSSRDNPEATCGESDSALNPVASRACHGPR